MILKLTYDIKRSMKMIAQIKLLPTPQQTIALCLTLERANAACNNLSALAWQEQKFGYCDKSNWKSQGLFCCGSCGHTTSADVNAAKNIRDWAAVNQPGARRESLESTPFRGKPRRLWAWVIDRYSVVLSSQQYGIPQIGHSSTKFWLKLAGNF